jgi:bifunctional non-homologous end joining protein LigD
MLSRTHPAGFIEPCQPIGGRKPPSGPGWIHEIKHDGYRLMALRRGVGARLLTRKGNNWTELYPSVVAALYALKVKSCLIDGEITVCDERGLAVVASVAPRQPDQARSGAVRIRPTGA